MNIYTTTIKVSHKPNLCQKAYIHMHNAWYILFCFGSLEVYLPISWRYSATDRMYNISEPKHIYDLYDDNFMRGIKLDKIAIVVWAHSTLCVIITMTS